MLFIEIKFPGLCQCAVLSARGCNSLSPLGGAKAQIGKALDEKELFTSVFNVLI